MVGGRNKQTKKKKIEREKCWVWFDEEEREKKEGERKD